MVYIGNSSTANFSSVTKDTFNGGDTSGASSVSEYTLSKTATTNGVAVYVENVRQIPTTAYTVSGTTLTFTGTTPSGTNNVYVMHHNSPVSTATHPATQDLTAANATLTGDVTVGSGTAADRKIVFDGNAQDYHVGLDDSADSLIIGKGSALGTTSHIVTDANGHVTMPLQPSFLVQPTSIQENIAYNTWTTVIFGTERYDTNGDFASNVFTAPVTGKYILTTNLDMRNIDDDVAAIYVVFNSSNRTYYAVWDIQDVADGDLGQWSLGLSSVVDMDASDTCNVRVWHNGSTNVDIHTDSFFSGALLG